MNGHATLNRAFTLVWSDALQGYVVAPETARRKGKSSGRVALQPLVQATVLALSAMGAGGGHAELVTPTTVVPANSNTTAYVSANGVAVVNIATANSAGLSHNYYTNYNVDSKGLVLNNGNTSEISRQSQLAGKVLANTNLAAQAKIILNEVVSTSRSTLAGYTEVLGGKADVIVANPNGITCSGCGFINTDRVTLTTGTPNIGGDGSLAGFTVNRGDILINGAGLNASAQQILDLVARTVKVDGQINVPDLGIVAGANNWSYGTRDVTGSATASGTVTGYAIDSSALGGMYAGKIRLIATEAGVGVRMLGEAAATASDFTLSAAGQIDIRSKVSAERDLALRTTASGRDAISLTDASLSARHDLSLSATAGGATLNGGVLVASNDLSVALQSLTDSASSTALTDNNKRYAGGALTLNVSDDANLNGSSWGAGGAFDATVGSLTVGTSGAALYAGTTLALTATTGDLGLGTASVKSVNNMSLTATRGSISTTAGTDQGVQSTAGDITVSAAVKLTNAGVISADAGRLTVQVDDAVDNSGTLHASKDMSWQSRTGGAIRSVSNSGEVLADALLTGQAETLSNTNKVQALGGSSLNVGTLSNSGTMYLSAASGTGATLTVGKLTNNGVIVSDAALTLAGRTAAAMEIQNNARIQAAKSLSIYGQNHSNAAKITLGTAGRLISETLGVSAQSLVLNDGAKVSTTDNLSITTDALTMGGSSSAIVGATTSGTMVIDVAGALVNNGAIHSGHDLLLTASSINNTGTGGISALETLDVSAISGNFDNYGALYAGQSLVASASGTFTNQAGGTLDSDGTMDLSAKSFVNHNTINAKGDITITAETFSNDVVGDLTRQWTVTNDSGDVYDRRTSGWCVSCGYNPVRDYYHRTWDEVESFVSFDPTSLKPQIIAGSNATLTIKGFNTGTNKGGVLSGGTVNLTGASSSATFVVDDLSLSTKHQRRDWNNLKKWYGVVGAAISSGDNIENDTGTYTVSTTSSSYGAGIYGTYQVNLSKFSLSLEGAPYTATTKAKSANGVAASTDGTLTFSGLTIKLPTNPNGYFVLSKDPSSQYLVETNPLYGINATIGSSYLASLLGYDPDQLQKRLGDSNYEAYLIRQQLISQTGNNILTAYANETEQLKGLMANAAEQSKDLGLTWGKGLSPDQIANLKEDMVWMVETTVAGQKVLAPVVYLAATTKASIDTGVVIASKEVNAQVASLTNKGGTISGSTSVNIQSTGDITNLSGTIKGGDVSLASTEGSIRNETVASTTGNDQFAATVVGKTATIQSTGNLNLDAAKDITVKGAQVAAGGDARLAAGNDIVFDTIENKSAKTTASSSSNGLSSTTTTTTVATTEQIKSGLTVGGNVDLLAKHDIVLAGTDVTAAGNANLEAGNNVSFLARANTTTTTSTSTTEGFGVGGGLVGNQQTDSTAFSSRNVGSTLTAGGDASIKAKNDITFEGAKVDVKGNGSLDAGNNINVLAGKDADYTTTKTTTTTFLKVEGSGSADAGAQAGATSTASGRNASASAGASADASANGQGGLILGEHSTTTTQTTDERSVGSSLNFGGNVDVKAGNTVTLKGSELAGGGDVNVAAKDVKVLAAENVKTSTTTTSTTSIGFMAESENKASAQANAGASTNGVGSKASADASAEASTDNKLALARQTDTTETSLDVTHTGSAIKSGGNMSVKASNGLTTVGSSLESGGNMDLQAKDMSFQAAQDVHETTKSSSVTSLGFYADAKGSAEAGAKGNAINGGATTTGSASAGAEANANVGLYGSNTTSSEVKGSTTAVTSSIKSGGNMTRTATNSITDVGTAIEAGGDFTQSAKTITSVAARDTTYESTKSDTNTAKLGMYAEASAEGKAGAGGMGAGGKPASGSADASAGFSASYENEQSRSAASTSTAVVSTIKSGGKVTSTSSGATTMEGTQIAGGKDVTLNAGSLDYKAAANTSTSSSTDQKAGGEIKVDISLERGSASGNYETSTTKTSESQAVVGGITSGGKLNINTKGDARLEGTNLSSADSTNIDVGGNLKVDAARNTQSTETKGFGVSATVAVGKSESGAEGGFGLSGNYNDSSAKGSQAVTSTIQSGGALNIKSGGNASFEGTNLAAAGDANVSAKGDLAFNAAKDTASSKSLDVSASIGGSGSKDKGGTKDAKTGKTSDPSSESEGSFGVGVNVGQSSSSTAKAGSISSGGNLKLSSGRDTVLEGTDVAAAGKASIAAGGNVIVKAAESTSQELNVGVALGGSGSSKTTTKSTTDASGNTTKTPTKQTVAETDNSFDISGGQSTQAKGATIKGGQGVDITAGKNVALEGTQVASGGDTNIAAGGQVSMTAAKSSAVSGALGLQAGSSGTGVNQADISVSNSQQATQITSAGGLKVTSGAKVDTAEAQLKAGGPIQISPAAGVPFKTTVSLPTQLPAGKKVEVKTADGKAIPSWVKFDPATGALTGTPPADFKGVLNLVVKVPQADGSSKSVPVKLGQ